MIFFATRRSDEAATIEEQKLGVNFAKAAILKAGWSDQLLTLCQVKKVTSLRLDLNQLPIEIVTVT